jgi:uncharacterized protein YbaP (TraB family)
MKVLSTIFILLGFVALGQSENSLFWQVKSPDGKTLSYLFGTMHVVSKDKFLIPDKVLKALEGSEEMVVEVSADISQDEIMKLSQSEDQRLTDYLNQAEKDSLYAYVGKRMNLDSSKFEYVLGKYKPFIFSQFSMMSILLNGQSFEIELMQFAKEKEITISGLETYAQQMGMFDALEDNLQKELIMSIVRDTSDLQDTWNRTENMYLNQELSSFIAELSSNAALTNFMTNTLLKDRNQKWLIELSDLLQIKKTFVAVGAAHLAGPDGIVQGLRDLGFSITPIKINMIK